MELGQKLKQARLEAGLSQRQVCADTITRNMLSQIENGSARPSMETLRYLAGKLGKTVSFFLEEDAVTSPNQNLLARCREAVSRQDWKSAREELNGYRTPDPLFDAEYQLLVRLTALGMAEQALQQEKQLYGIGILEEMGRICDGYCAQDLEHRRLLLLGKLSPARASQIVPGLPDLDGELMLRARAALEEKQYDRSGALLDAAENREDPVWNYLRGHVYAALGQFRQAAACYHKAEKTMPEQTAPCLERCYRELEDFKQAYFYACSRRGKEATE